MANVSIQERVSLLKQTFGGYDATLDSKVRKKDKYGIDWCAQAKKLLSRPRKDREGCWFLQVRIPNDFMTRERFDECVRVCGYAEQKQAWGIQALKRLDAETNARKKRPSSVTAENGAKKITSSPV